MEGLMSLINATEYAGYTVREWNIVQFSKLSSALLKIATEYDKRGVAFSDLSSILTSVDLTGGASLPVSVLNLLEPLLEHSTLILSVSLKANYEQLEALNYTSGLVLLLLVLKVNLEHLSGFFGKLVEVPASLSQPSLT